jgi:hypothetical protein
MLKVGRANLADFLDGGGEMGALTRGHDWSATPLGPPEGWPQSLRTAVRILLNTNHPMFIPSVAADPQHGFGVAARPLPGSAWP